MQVGLALSVSVIVLLLLCGGTSAGLKCRLPSTTTEGRISARPDSLNGGSGHASTSTPGSAAQPPHVQPQEVPCRPLPQETRVLIFAPAGIFMLLKKSAQSSEKMVVLKDNVQSPEDRL